jgi:hypothetical protein
MDKAWEDLVTKIERGKIEEIENQHNLSPDEVATDEKHDERKLEKVVEYEVTSHSSGSIDIVRIS